MVLVALLTAGAFVVVSQRAQLNEQIDEQLLATPLPNAVRQRPRTDVSAAPAPPARPEPETDTANLSDLFVAVIDVQGQPRTVLEGQLLEDMPSIQSVIESPPAENELATVQGVNGVSTFRVRYEPATDESFAAVLALPVDDVNAAIRQLTLTLLGVAAAIALVLALIGSWVSRFGLRPISEMTDVAEAISSGERDRRVEEQVASTEAGRLAQSFNLMLDERDASDARLHQFVSNASHELRTPLTSIRGYLDLYVAGGFRKPGEFDDVVRRLQTEAERMNLLVDDLLVLANFDEQQPLDASQVDLAPMLRDVAALAEAAHPERRIDVSALPDSIEARVDRLRLHQAVAGLVGNAISHTPDDASISIAVQASAGRAQIVVADTGPGLTETEAATVFDRFARGDSSRARSTGGSGLGLSITKAIVEAHGGTISVEPTPGRGASFVIDLPQS